LETAPPSPSFWQNVRTASESVFTPPDIKIAINTISGIINDGYIAIKNHHHEGYLTDIYGDLVGADDRTRAGVNTALLTTSFISAPEIAATKAEVSISKNTQRAFHSGIGTKERAMAEFFETLGETRAGKNLQKLIDSKNIPWSEQEIMWGRLSSVWARGVPPGSTVPVFLNNPRIDAIFFRKELPILQSNNVIVIPK